MEYLPKVAGCKYFVNADLITAGLSPFATTAEPKPSCRSGPIPGVLQLN